MRVTLMKDNEFGPDGPQAGDKGEVIDFVQDDYDSVWFWVWFKTHQQMNLCSLEMISVPDTSGVETVLRAALDSRV